MISKYLIIFLLISLLNDGYGLTFSSNFTFIGVNVKISKHKSTEECIVVNEGNVSYVYNLTSQTQLDQYNIGSNITLIEANQKILPNFIKIIRVYFHTGTSVIYNDDNCTNTSMSSYNVNVSLDRILAYNNQNQIIVTSLGNNLYFNLLNPQPKIIASRSIPRISSDSNSLFVKSSCKIMKYVKNGTDWIDTGISANFRQNASCNSSTFRDIQITKDNKIFTIGQPNFYVGELNFNTLATIQFRMINIFTYDGNCKIPLTSNDRMFCRVSNASGFFVICYNLINHTYTVMDDLGIAIASTDLKFEIISQQFVLIQNKSAILFEFCGKGMYYSVDSYNCANCTQGCQKCNYDKCLRCFPNYQLIGLLCQMIQIPALPTNISIKNCLDGFYFDFKDGKCRGCQIQCKKCVNNASLCTQYFYYYQVDTQGNFQLSISYKVIAEIISFPMIRLIFNKGIVIFFLADKLWFFQYHNRSYPTKMGEILQAIRFQQTIKLSPVQVEPAYEKLQKYLPDSIVNFQQYEQCSHKGYYKIQRTDSTLLHKSYQFLTRTVPTTCIIFFILYGVFHLTQSHPWSIYFRKFSFFGFIFVGLIEPNIQLFTFLSINQMKCSFYLTFTSKLLQILWLLLFYVVFIYATCFYLMIFYFYGRQAKYYIDGCYRIFPSFVWATYELGIKNLILGVINGYLYHNYKVQIISLMIMELISVSFSIYFWKSYGSFKISSVQFVNTLISTLFSIICLTLIIDLEVVNPTKEGKELMDYVVYAQIIILTLCCFLSTILNLLVPILIDIAKSFKEQQIEQKKNEEKKKKQQQEEMKRQRQRQRIKILNFQFILMRESYQNKIESQQKNIFSVQKFSEISQIQREQSSEKSSQKPKEQILKKQDKSSQEKQEKDERRFVRLFNQFEKKSFKKKLKFDK